jgi:predicted DsbA family dithiol-disulfide isomerase
MDAPVLAAVAIDVVSDVVCPWCYLGKHRLEAAIAMVPEVAAEVRWHPFQLDASIPQGGIDRAEYIRRKFGDASRIEPIHQRLTDWGHALGIDYHFERITRSPNTIDVHRLVRLVSEAQQNDAVEALFKAYFTDGRDVGDHAVLADIGSAFGLDRGATLASLAGDEGRAAVLAEIEDAYRVGINGVPCFILNQRYAVMGAEAPETIAKAIRQAATAGAVANSG